eukprot:TRINITY_DN1897_c0_g4_i1.p1 TRINITY_DN1897_c0_g4~~TRINITY_DN1897_c0_g4_i1.p1  ORF type:complete len:234 (+),score=91.55 TRINITY_DN1897_c0_g4_i1:24-704(+)
MVLGKDFSTSDPLGLGGLLVDCHRIFQLIKLMVPMISNSNTTITTNTTNTADATDTTNTTSTTNTTKPRFDFDLDQKTLELHLHVLAKLLGDLLVASVLGLKAFERKNNLNHPSRFRLAFREFGLVIGLQAAKRLKMEMRDQPALMKMLEGEEEGEGEGGGEGGEGELLQLVEKVLRFEPMAEQIWEFWEKDENREGGTWKEHQDINDVMWAVSLLPEAFVQFRGV